MRRILLLIICVISTWAAEAQDITIYRSSHTYEATISRLDSILDAKNYTRYKTVVNEFSTDSIEYYNQVFSFEDRMLTRKIIACEPSATLDLPLKIVVWREDADVFLGFVDPQFMKRRFRIHDCNDQLKDLTAMLVRVINECIRKV